mmetsp:Transcript_24780/g.69017  ORF Transcript_24780/g.69017 Transcript_24780/m.69017 type:complete len:205 (+) Transcript_24780:987-1601(+)
MQHLCQSCKLLVACHLLGIMSTQQLAHLVLHPRHALLRPCQLRLGPLSGNARLLGPSPLPLRPPCQRRHLGTHFLQHALGFVPLPHGVLHFPEGFVPGSLQASLLLIKQLLAPLHLVSNIPKHLFFLLHRGRLVLQLLLGCSGSCPRTLCGRQCLLHSALLGLDLGPEPCLLVIGFGLTLGPLLLRGLAAATPRPRAHPAAQDP